MKIEIGSNIVIKIDTGMMLPVPQEKIEQCIGQIITRFARWNCSHLIIMNDGNKGDLISYFYSEKNGKRKLELGANWRPETQEYTFNS